MNDLNEFKEEPLSTGNGDRLFHMPGFAYGEVLYIQRKNLREHTKYYYLKHKGIYIIMGEGTYYVGKAHIRSLYNRLNGYANKNSDKNWWKEAICIIDNRGQLDDSRLGFLEHCLIKSAKEAKELGSPRLHLENYDTPNFNIMDGAEHYLNAFLENVHFVLNKIEAYETYICSTLFHRIPSNSEAVTDIEKITGFIDMWSTDIERDNQYRKRNGWTVRPSQGNLDQDMFERLQNWLTGMFPNGNKNYFVCNLYSVNKIREEFNLYSKKSDPSTPSDELFIRQEKNYMDKLELIKKVDGDSRKYELTDRGKEYLNAPLENLREFLIIALEYYRWFGINIRDFARDVLYELGSTEISKDEFTLFLSHGGVRYYRYYKPVDIAYLIKLYRGLSASNKLYVNKYAERMIHKIDESRSQTSYQRIRGAQCKEAMSDILGNDLFGDHKKLKKKYKIEKLEYLQEKVF